VGLVPFWAKDIKVGSKMANSRAETVHEKPSFRTPFKSRCALIAVDAFYEWLETDQVSEKSGKKQKQPFALPVRPTAPPSRWRGCTRCGGTSPSPRTIRWRGCGRTRSSTRPTDL
jgi:hypothetical protein